LQRAEEFVFSKKLELLENGLLRKENNSLLYQYLKIKNFLSLSLFFFAVLEFELRALHLLGRCSTTWAHSSSPYFVEYFWDRVLWTICSGLLWTMILLISASWVARITGPSPAPRVLLH
jgi:hypothetical protein